jgi:hypothetical protein
MHHIHSFQSRDGAADAGLRHVEQIAVNTPIPFSTRSSKGIRMLSCHRLDGRHASAK